MNIDRVNSELAKQIGQIIQYELNDPRLSGLLTVMEVRTSDDLSYAKVFVSYYGELDKEEGTFKTLQSCAGHIRSLLRTRVRLRNIPQLQIVKDTTLAFAEKINNVIDKAMQSTKENNGGDK